MFPTPPSGPLGLWAAIAVHRVRRRQKLRIGESPASVYALPSTLEREYNLLRSFAQQRQILPERFGNPAPVRTHEHCAVHAVAPSRQGRGVPPTHRIRRDNRDGRLRVSAGVHDGRWRHPPLPVFSRNHGEQKVRKTGCEEATLSHGLELSHEVLYPRRGQADKASTSSKKTVTDNVSIVCCRLRR